MRKIMFGIILILSSLRGIENAEAIQKENCVDCHESTQSVDSRNDDETLSY